jgi:SpoVK/Ycf46/Vps4 family AAA+-type ATPase
MLNFSKNFVTYLDNYDKNRQHTYENNLLVNVETEFLTNFKLEKTNTLYFPVLPPEHNNDISYNAQNDTLKGVFDILKNNSLFDKDISPQLSPQNKKKFEIKEQIESIDDLINIIDTYNNFNEYEYNIDVRLLKKIKPELVSLNDMIGIKKLKQNVLDQLLYFIQNLHISDEGGDYKHTVIYGPPGTGKTEIAKIIGTMYSKIGVLSENKFMKVSRQDLIAGYLGQTAIKTAKVVQKALGGVLFIDEAYSLASTEKEDSFSKECLDTYMEIYNGTI